MTDDIEFKARIAEVLEKYNVKLAAAPLDALTMAMDRMIGNRTPSCTFPHLGLATTGELLDELRARIEIYSPGGLDYRTVGGEEIIKRGPVVRSRP